MNMRLREYITALVCLLFAAGTALSSFGGVLCLSGDGQVKIESFCQQSCAGDGETCTIDATETGHDHRDGCVDCTDLPLYQDSHSRRFVPTRIDQPVAHYLSTTACGSITSPALSETSLRSTTSGFSSQIPRLLSSTVLIC